MTEELICAYCKKLFIRRTNKKHSITRGYGIRPMTAINCFKKCSKLWNNGNSKRQREERIKITKEVFEECKIPEPKLSIIQTFENGDESYEDENYIGWNGMCVKKLNNDLPSLK